MSVTFKTTTPNKLLAAFRKAIDDKKVVTWAYDSDGDFYHKPEQWRGKGWLRPKVIEGTALNMRFLGVQSHQNSWAAYSVLQGRFIESMIEHCHDLFITGSATAKPDVNDSPVTQAA